MKKVAIIVPEGPAILSSIVGSFKLFGQVNNFLRMQGLPDFYELQLVGLSKEAQLYDGLFSIKPHATINEVGKVDLVIVTTITGDLDHFPPAKCTILFLDSETVRAGSGGSQSVYGGFFTGGHRFT